MLKRICIFCFYDPDGIVDDYVTYLLDDIKPLVKRFVIVCNCNVDTLEKNKFLKYSDEVIIRENNGFDGGAYREILLNYIKKDELLDYDELILMNDTFFGPFYAFQNIFEVMERKICDIWGITKYGKFMLEGKEQAPHLQSYFLVIKKKVFLSNTFFSFWRDMKRITNFDNAIVNFEIEFSIQMSKAGYILKSYLDAEEFISDDSSLNYNYPQSHCGELIINYRFPLIKKKCLIGGYTNNNNPILAMEYISNNTFYDANLIWQHLLRRYDLSDIRKSLSLQYIINDSVEFDCNFEKIGIVILIHSKRQLKTIMQYILQIPRELELYFIIIDQVVSREDVQCYSFHNTYEFRNEKGNNDSQIIFARCNDLFFKYDYLCVLSDEEIADRWLITIQQLMQDSFSSCLGSIEYIISLFEKNSRLGVLFPSSIRFSYQKWSNALYEESRRLCEYNKIPIRFHRGKNIMDSRTSFWCRTEAIVNTLPLEKFSNFTEREWINWTRCLPYICQANGYYTGYISTIEQSQRMIAQDEQENKTLSQIKNKYYLLSVLTKQLIGNNVNKVYIYGCGKVADYVYEVCQDAGIMIEAFIISDSQKKEKYHLGKEVIWISDYKNDKGDIIIVGVGNRLRDEIVSLLDERKSRYITI